jgi:hypothetical protein
MFDQAYRVDTPVGADVLARWAASWIGPRRGLFHLGGPPYGGSFSYQGFQIRRHTNSRNSFLPIVTATFLPHAGGTSVDVTVAAPRFAVALAATVLSVLLVVTVTAAAVVIAIAVNIGEPGLLLAGLAPVLPVVVGAVFTVSFRVGAARARHDLELMLTGQQPGAAIVRPRPGP